MKIYTKTGDAGLTSLIGGTKVVKSHLRIESYGTVDELNSYIGWVRDLLTDSQVRDILSEIQDRLFTIGSSLACDPEKEPAMKIPDLLESDVLFLEKEIDAMREQTFNFSLGNFFPITRLFCSRLPVCVPHIRYTPALV